MTPRKLVLTVFFGSVVINALLGIAALVSGEFGDLETKILVTSTSVSAASILSLAMFPARERGLLGQIPNTGIGLSVIGFVLLVFLVWTDWDSEVLGKTAGSILIFAVAASYVSLVSLAVIRPEFTQIVHGAYVLTVILSAMIASAIWGEPGGDVFGRIIGVISILLAAATVSIPVLHRISRDDATAKTGPDDSAGYEHVYMDRLPTICLSCGSTGIAIDEDGRCECSECNARYLIEVPTN